MSNSIEKTVPVLPGIDMNGPGFQREKRERMSTKQQVEAFIEQNARVVNGQVRFGPGEFHAFIHEVFDSAYSIGLKEGNKLSEWNARMK